MMGRLCQMMDEAESSSNQRTKAQSLLCSSGGELSQDTFYIYTKQ